MCLCVCVCVWVFVSLGAFPCTLLFLVCLLLACFLRTHNSGRLQYTKFKQQYFRCCNFIRYEYLCLLMFMQPPSQSPPTPHFPNCDSGDSLKILQPTIRVVLK